MIEATTPVGSARPETARHRSLTLRPVAEWAMVGLARLLIRTFFRQVEVEDGARLRSDRPTVLVANHRNGLVDGLLLMAALGRCPRFLGKSTLFHNPLLWPFLKLGGVVPIYRAADGATMTRNSATFSVSNRLLARGGMVAIFPEGISHDEPALQPLRTGAARIALGAATNGVPKRWPTSPTSPTSWPGPVRTSPLTSAWPTGSTSWKRSPRPGRQRSGSGPRTRSMVRTAPTEAIST